MMADRRKAALEHDWNLQSHLMALLANINRDSKQKPAPFVPDDFNPMRNRGEKEKPTQEDLNERLERLKKLFPD